MLIDSIVHATADGRWFGTHFDASANRLLREMDEAGLAKAVLVGLASSATENRELLDIASRHRDRLIPCGGFNPTAHTRNDVGAAIRAEFHETEFRAVKFHPRFGDFDIHDPRFLAALDEIASWQRPIPIWLDTFLYRAKAPLRSDPVTALHRLATTYPSLTFVFLHGTGASLLPLYEAIRFCHNTFLDVSYTLCHYQGSSLDADLRWIARHFDQRMLWGSDFPEIGIPDALALARSLLCDIGQDKFANITGLNLARIFSLSVESNGPSR